MHGLRVGHNNKGGGAQRSLLHRTDAEQTPKKPMNTEKANPDAQKGGGTT